MNDLISSPQSADGRLRPSFRRDLFLSFAAVLGAIQLLSLVVLVWEHAAPAQSSLSQIVFPEWKRLLNPERDMMYFRLFIFLSLGAGALCFTKFRRKKEDLWEEKILPSFLGVEAVLTALILAALFKSIVYSSAPQLSLRCYDVLIALAAINKLFFPWIVGKWRVFWNFITALPNAPMLGRVFETAFIIFLIASIYLPDPEGVIARMFIGEQLQHFDGTVMAAGWSYVSGHTMDIDNISQYGIGLPIITSWIARLLGGFTYPHMLSGLVLVAIVYFAAWYFLLRRWLQSPVLAAAAVLFGLRVQMFHTGVYPMVFTYPATSVIRYFLDVGLMTMIFLHLVKPRRDYLIGAALFCAVSVFNITSEGVYQTATLYTYLLMHLVVPSLRGVMFSTKRDKVLFPVYFLITPLVALLFFIAAEGHYLWTAEFSKNIGEFINYFLSGFGLTPMDQSLRERNFLASLMGFVIPATYLLTITVVGAWVWLKNAPRIYIFPVLLALYGLADYTYYIARSAQTSYYAVGLPFVFIVFFWLAFFLRTWPESLRKKAALAVFIVSLFALMTNHNFMSYPNALNWSRNPLIDPLVIKKLPDGRPYFNHLFGSYPDAFKLSVNNLGETNEELLHEENFKNDEQLKRYFRSRFDFSQDAAMIQSLTRPDENVALISSFEVRILMQAQRAPFFYYFPLVLSRPMGMRVFTFTSLYTQDHLKKTIGQLDHAKPQYVFMERLLLNRSLPASYQYQLTATVGLLDYIFVYYAPYAQGKFLVAMKRK